MTFELLLSYPGVYQGQLLSKDNSLYELLTLLHQGVGEDRTVDSIVPPATNSVANSSPDICQKEGIFTRSFGVLRNLESFSDEDKLVIFSLDTCGLVSLELRVV